VQLHPEVDHWRLLQRGIAVILNSPVTRLGGTGAVPFGMEVSIDSIEAEVMTLVLCFDPWIRVEVKEPVSPELTHIVVADPDGACWVTDHRLGNTQTDLSYPSSIWVAEAMVIVDAPCWCKAGPIFDGVALSWLCRFRTTYCVPMPSPVPMTWMDRERSGGS